MIANERQKHVASVSETLEAGWAATASWLRELAEGRVPGTNKDRLVAASILGRTQAAFTDRIETSPTGVIEYRRLAGDVDPQAIIEAAQVRPTVLPGLPSGLPGT